MLNLFLEKLFALQRKQPVIENLDHLIPVLQALGNPHLDFASIHVAGTNGKGSVTSKIAAGLQASGKIVGLYTSPHLLRFSERIRINDKEIDSDKIIELGMHVMEAAKRSPLPLHFFEITTLMAFLYFAHSGVDIAVLETGLGGSLDATNVVYPLLSVITSISLDHTDRLGDTIESIAMQKAGIIKKRVPVILGPNARCVSCMQKAKEQDSIVHFVKEYTCSFEEENQAIAKKALDILGLDQQAIQIGLEYTPPCRFQIQGDVIFDVAHNPDGFLKLFTMFRRRFPHHRARLVLGVSLDKDIETILKIVADNASFVHLVEAQSLRAVSWKRMSLSCPYSKEPSLVGGGLERALIEKQKDEKIIICGSFYVVAESLASLNNSSSSWGVNTGSLPFPITRS